MRDEQSDPLLALVTRPPRLDPPADLVPAVLDRIAEERAARRRRARAWAGLLLGAVLVYATAAEVLVAAQHIEVPLVRAAGDYARVVQVAVLCLIAGIWLPGLFRRAAHAARDPS